MTYGAAHSASPQVKTTPPPPRPAGLTKRQVPLLWGVCRHPPTSTTPPAPHSGPKGPKGPKGPRTLSLRAGLPCTAWLTARGAHSQRHAQNT